MLASLLAARSHLPGVLAGVVVGLLGLLLLVLALQLWTSCSPGVVLEVNYLGGIEIREQTPSEPAPQDSDGGLLADACESDMDPLERLVTIIALLSVFVLAGAVGARIGESHSTLRGVVAAQFTSLGVAIILRITDSSMTTNDFMLLGAVGVLLATVLGLVAGHFSKRFP